MNIWDKGDDVTMCRRQHNE